MVKTINPEAPADALVTASSAQRQAWLDAPVVAAELDTKVRVLFATAALYGAPADVAYLTGATDVATTEYQIALATDPDQAHRRKVWIVWPKTDGRTGRWGALAALGVKLRAAANPSKLTPYSRPEQPITVKTPGGKLAHWDPHDGDLPSGYQPAPVGWLAEPQNTRGVI